MANVKSESRKWRAVEIGQDQYVVEDGEHSRTLSGQHCKCCALVTAIQEYGGRADLRGLHVHGPCYQFLVVSQRMEATEDEEDTKADGTST